MSLNSGMNHIFDDTDKIIFFASLNKVWALSIIVIANEIYILIWLKNNGT